MPVSAERKSPSIWQFLLSTGVVVIILIYGMITINTGDPRWFDPRFEAQPVAITVYCYGAPVEVARQSETYRQITALFNAALSGTKHWDSLSLSDVTFNDYHTHPRMVALELQYAPPVRIHSSVKYFSDVGLLIMPLKGRHAQTNAVFGRNQGFPIAGSFHVEDTTPLKEYITAQGLCDLTP